MDKLKQEVRKLVKRHMSLKGHALLAEGKRRRHSSRKASGRKVSRHSTRRHSSRKMSGHALLAEGKRRRHSSRKASGRKVSRHSTRRHSVRHMSGKAMLAEGKHKRRGAPRGNHSALLEINKIARELKRKHPHLEHREAISEASAHYRKMNGSARHSTKRYSRHY